VRNSSCPRQAFGQGFLRLVDPHGQLLNPLQSLEDSGLQESDTKLKLADFVMLS